MAGEARCGKARRLVRRTRMTNVHRALGRAVGKEGADDSDFFAPRFEEAGKVGGRMIKAIQEAQKAHGH